MRIFYIDTACFSHFDSQLLSQLLLGLPPSPYLYSLAVSCLLPPWLHFNNTKNQIWDTRIFWGMGWLSVVYFQKSNVKKKILFLLKLANAHGSSVRHRCSWVSFSFHSRMLTRLILHRSCIGRKSLIPLLFNKIIVAFIIEAYLVPSHKFLVRELQKRHVFPPMEWACNPIRKQ